MAFITDYRNGVGESVAVELQTESERQIGIDSQGRQRFVYFTNSPQIIIKTTRNVVGTEGDWGSEISKVESSYNNITTVPTGLFTESVTSGGGWFIIGGENYYGGTIVEADYSNLIIGNPPIEYKILISESSNISPSGYLPDGTSYFSGSLAPLKYNRTSVCTLAHANSFKVGSQYNNGLISSKNISNPKLINNTLYVDLSLEISELKASISVF